jgi:hypothetical protein
MEGEGELAAPRRAHLESMARQGDAAAQAELDDVPAMPAHAEYLWRAFWDLRATLQGGGMAPPRITRHDIHAWERDERTDLASWERRAILRLDAALLAANAATTAR